MDFFSRMRQPPSKVIAGYQLKAGREGKREIRREVSEGKVKAARPKRRRIGCVLRLVRSLLIYNIIHSSDPNGCLFVAASAPGRHRERAAPDGRLQPLRQGQLRQHLQGRAQGRAPRHRKEPHRRKEEVVLSAVCYVSIMI